MGYAEKKEGIHVHSCKINCLKNNTCMLKTKRQISYSTYGGLGEINER